VSTRSAGVLAHATPSGTREERRFRLDVQALRAVAIGAVVLNHLWPTYVGGGYVGVDVFFVISGFLITGHLVGEATRTGRIRLGAFYARRIRRLLPASLLVLAVSAVLAWVFLPYPRWERNAAEIAASAGYVENWLLATLSVDYSAANDSASVAQHFWSLSVEEQFYLIWPVLIVLTLAALAWRGRRVDRTRTVVTVLVGILVVSLVASIVYTAVAPQQAYFVTFTRAWEFAAGGTIAVLGSRIRMPRLAANALAMMGFAAVGVSVFWYGSQTPFPGVAALLPVLGTAAIIAAGTAHGRLWHSWITDRKPVQWLGGVSYSLYLWHWPLIVVAPFALQRELSGSIRVGLLVVALALAWVTKLLVEDPGRTWTFWSSSTRRSVGLMVAGMATVMALAGALLVGYHVESATDSPELPVATGSCVGPAALADPESCTDPFGPPGSAVMTKKNEYYYVPPECDPESPRMEDGRELKHVVCDFSRPDTPSEDVWLVGDSHAQQWQGAVFELARERGWRVTTSYLGGCPVADVAFIGFRSPAAPSDAAACREWSRTVSTAILDARPDVVFTAMAARLQLVDDGSGRPPAEQFVDGLMRDWTQWADAGIRVVGIADPPLNAEVRSTDCVLLNASDPVACARPRSEAQPPDPIVTAGARVSRPGIGVVDLTDRFCDAEQCYAVVGGVPVYFDPDHLNLQYVRMLAPDLAAALDAL
jgi:peptidoglycan/LPS O-acetylase OafA/YrhL